MDVIINTLNAVFGLMFRPFTGMRPDYALAIITAVAGIVMLYLYKWTSNQDALKLAQDKVKAYILEIRLYQTDLPIMLRALVRVFIKNFTYLKLLLLPATFLIFIVILLVVQCYPRFQFRPLAPGEPFIFEAALAPGQTAPPTLTVPAGVTVETAPLTMPSINETDWRIRADAPGEYYLKVKAGSEEQTRRLIVGGGMPGVSPVKGVFSLGGYMENPLETPLADSSAFREITINYPERVMDSPVMLGMSWLIYFFVVSFVVAFAAKVVLKVK